MSQTLNLAIVLDSDGSLPDGTITGAEIANSSIQTRHLEVGAISTDVLAEGSSNLFYTNARARLAITVEGGGYYDNSTGVITVGGAGLNTDNVIEGSANLYFTNTRARAALSPYDATIIYDAANGTIRANAAALGGVGGGPNVISVNQQVGVVTLTSTHIPEGANLYFTTARTRAAFNPDSTVTLNTSNGLLSVGQNVRPGSNVVFNELDANLITLNDYYGTSGFTTVYYDANANSISLSSNLLPIFDDEQALGDTNSRFSNLYVGNVITGNIAAERVIADQFIGNFTGDFVKTIEVTTNYTALIIDSSSNPDLFIPKGSKVVFDVSDNNLIGVGFDIGNFVDNELTASNELPGIIYKVAGADVDYTTYIASFNGANTRSLTYTIPQSAFKTLVYYSLNYNNWRGKLVVSPASNSDEIDEGTENLYYTDAKVAAFLLTAADANTGLYYDEQTSLLTLAQDISPAASPTFVDITANAIYGTVYGDFVGNITGTLTDISFTTDAVDEGNVNLYFSIPRARLSIDNGYGLEYNPISGVMSLAQTPALANTYGSSKVIPVFTIDDYGRVMTISNVSANLHTSEIPESSSNLYYTNARVVAVVTDLLGNVGAGNITANVITTGNTVITDNGVTTGNTTITGDSIVTGETTITSNSITTATLYGNVEGNVNGYVSSISNFSTSNLTEGDNLYFTNARARAAISVVGTGSYDEANGIITITGGVESVNGATGNVVLTTANIAESGNLYFTNARSRASIGTEGIGINYYEANGNILLNLSNIIGEVNRYEFVTSNGQTIYTGTDATGNTLATPPSNQPAINYVYLNGVLLTPSDDYSINTTHLVFTQPTDAGSNLTIISQKTGIVLTNPGVNSINGLQGDVILTTANIALGPNLSTGNLTVTDNITTTDLNVTGVISVTGAMLERANIRDFAPDSTIIANILTDTILYYTTNVSQNVTFNMTGLDNTMQVSDVVTFSLFMTVGPTAKTITAFQIDGTATTAKWSGAKPATGTAGNVDLYSISVFKVNTAPGYRIFVNTLNYN